MVQQPSTSTRPERPIFPRKMNFPFGEAGIPRYWLADSPTLTHVANGLNLVFPLGERFFIRSCKPYMHLAEGELLEQLRGFMAQEVRHGLEHERFFQILEDQGFDVATIVERYEHLAYGLLEPRFDPKLRLATTAALEHFTAILGDVVLREGLDEAHPVVAELLMWHAAEEIEHKAVTFDLLQRVDESYLTRALGLLIATVVLAAFWQMCTRALLEQEAAMEPPPGHQPAGRIPLARRLAELRGAFVARPIARRLAAGFVDYLRPDFHPDQHDNYHLATEYLASLGR